MPRVRLTELRRDSGGPADLLAVTTLPDRIVVALRANDGNLKLIVWDIANDGELTRRGDIVGGEVSRVAIAAWPDGPGVVTAVRTGEKTLKVIAWKIGAQGNIHRAGESGFVGAEVTDLSISKPSGFDGVVTASTDSSGDLCVAAWKLASDGTLQLAGAGGAGAATRVDAKALAQAGGLARVAVAMRNGTGGLEIITWGIASGGSVSRLGTAVAGPITDVALAARSTGNADLLSLTTGKQGDLTVIGWEVATDGSLKRISTGRGGTASSPDIVTWTPDIHTYAVGAVRDEHGKLKLIVWRNGIELVRHGELESEAVKEVVLAPWSGGIVTVTRDGSGELRVVSWRLRNEGIRLLRQKWPIPAHPSASAARLREPDPAGPSPHRATKYVIAPVSPSPPGSRPPPPPSPGGASGDSPAYASRFTPAVSGIDPMLAVGHQYVVITQDHQIAFYDRSGVALPSKHGEPINLSATSFFQGFITETNPDGTPNKNNINLISPLEIREFYDTRVTYDPQSRRFVIASAARQGLGTPPPRYYAIAVSKTEDPRDGFHQYMTTESNFRDFPRLVVHNGMVLVTHNDPAGAGEVDTPVLTGFDLSLLQDFVEDPPNWQYYQHDLAGAVRVFSVLHYGETKGMTFLFDIRTGDPVLRLSAFAKPAHPWLAPKPVFAEHALTTSAGWPGPFGVFRGSTLHLSSSVEIAARIADEQPPRRSVRTVRIPFSSISPSGIDVQGQAVVDRTFSDVPATKTWDTPHLAVNEDGDAIFVYGVTGVKQDDPSPPGVRYTVWRHGESKQRNSALLQAGSWQPMWKYEGDTELTVISHAYQLDYATAVVDPKDDKTFWMIHEYAEGASSSWTTVVGVVDPSA